MTTTSLPAARIPMPQEIQDLTMWKILTSVIFPAAKDPATIMLALRYCERRGLDVLKKPVNIVPVWNKALGRSVETIWPSITETEITASRSKLWAGLDAPTFGPVDTKTFIGKTQISVSFPQWCERTVYRMVAGERRAFTERVHWLESYGREGGTDVPNYMWAKRPHDQLAKVAKAAALRAAFPEESEGPSDAEMEGAIIPGEDITPPPKQPIPVKSPDRDDAAINHAIDIINGRKDGDENIGTPTEPYSIPVLNDSDWRPFGEKLIAEVRGATDSAVIAQWLNMNAANLATMAGRAAKLHATLMRSIGAHQQMLATPAPTPPEGADELPSSVDPERGEGPQRGPIGSARGDRPAGEYQ
jgi:phage recombination protein Bet